MGSFVRRVGTASGATAVQNVHKRGSIVVRIDHIGSTHDAETARQRLHAGQQVLAQTIVVATTSAAGRAMTGRGSSSRRSTVFIQPVHGVDLCYPFSSVDSSSSSVELCRSLGGC